MMKLFVDDEPFLLPTANRISFERVLDMQAGTLDRMRCSRGPCTSHAIHCRCMMESSGPAF